MRLGEQPPKKDKGDRASGLWTGGWFVSCRGDYHGNRETTTRCRNLRICWLWMTVQLFLASIGRMICGRC